MATASLYRRILPSPPAIDFASSEGKQLFVEAIQSQTMEGFFKLISYFQTQSEPAYCGLATLTMVLNALAIDPGKKWKGPWRWFDESMLDCCEPLERVKAKGISFGKLVCLAQCSGAKVLAFRTNQSTIDDFRKYVRACTSSDNCHLISSYHRGILKQTGTGHFSPIGGYHPGKDLALILDVARFKYPPHWIPLTLLWEAMNTVDETSDRLRGFMLISKLERPPALLYTLSCKNENWTGTAKYLIEHVPVLIKSEDMNDVKKVLMTILSSFPSDFGEFIKWVAEVRTREDGGQSLSQEERARLTIKEEILKQVQETGLYKHVKESLLSLRDVDNLSEIAAIVCCQGAGILSGGSLEKFCCREACIKCVKLNGGNKHVTLVSGTVSCGTSEQGVDVIVPSSSSQTLPNCTDMSPTSSDVLTVLLLALPPLTWNGIRNQSLLQEIKGLTLTADLPSLLQEEVLHLRSQLQLLERCKDNKLEEDFNAPLL